MCAKDGGDPFCPRRHEGVLQDEEALQLLTQQRLAQVSPRQRNHQNRLESVVS